MESWVLRRTRAAAAWAAQVNAEVAPTQVPQLSVELRAEPNKTVWTGFFHELLHSAPDLPLAKRPFGWFPSRSAGEVFALQARGSKAYNGVAFWVWHQDGRVTEHTRGPAERASSRISAGT